MKSILAILTFFFSITFAHAQTATNFTCNDCSGVSHDLFTDLDAGKVIVLVWVMPCGSCAAPTTMAYNTVQNYQTSNPNRVFLYVADDYGNSTCNTINSWCNSIGVTQNAWSVRFSNSAINMLNYGSTGMPKVVVLGGTSHTVFYNANNTFNQTSLQNAINAALLSTSVAENEFAIGLNVFPNPASTNSTANIVLKKKSDINISLFDLQGQLVKTVFTGTLEAGSNDLPIATAELPSAMYLVRVSDGKNENYRNLTVKH
ncbi:MAG: T9SS type A sorting domain-containing protein [Bacteroidota bacterium]|jgi:hypothetical protein